MTTTTRTELASPLLLPRPKRSLLTIFVIYLLSMVYPLVFLQEIWFGWFPATMSAFLLSTVFGSLTICTSAAWLAGSVRRSGLSEWTAASARGVRGVYRQPIAACTLLSVIAYTITFLAMVIMTMVRAPSEFPGGIDLSLVLIIAWASAVAWSAFGTILGRYLRSEIAIPLALILSYASYVVPVFYLLDTPLFGVLLTDGRPWTYLQPADFQLPAKLLFWSGLALFFYGVATSLRRLLETGAWITIAGLTAAAFVGSTLIPIAGAEERVCLGAEPRVCTDGAHAPALPEFHSLTSNALKVLPESLRREELDSTTTPQQGALPLAPMDGNTVPSLTIDRDMLLAALGEQIFFQCSPRGEEAQLTAAGLYAWWRIEQDISLRDMITFTGAPWLIDPNLSNAPMLAQELANLTEPERQTWFEENGPRISDCELDEVIWP
ncbi:hypothetical protein [uncultured Arthrobacter sp.]|uniref:hypothetical protein n=1 Tax=uncultured Arthrobacter sp. TaxID=114050 RepID=UPI002617E455|nr:hypothetical protein [uncultured Arthrobacter sp.]